MRNFLALSLLVESIVGGCSYRRDCSFPIVRIVYVEKGLIQTTQLAAREWKFRTNGGEILEIVPGIVDSPLPGEASLKIGSTLPDASGLYYPYARTAIVDQIHVNDLSIVMHELGHIMGAPHIGAKDTIMFPTPGLLYDKKVCLHLCCR